MSENTITREAAAKRLGCSMRTVERMLRDGRLHAIRHPDGRLAVDRADLELVLREPKLLETRRGRTDETLRADPPVATTTVQVGPDRLERIRDPEPTRPSLLERVTPLSPEPAPILPVAGVRSQRRARRPRLPGAVSAIATSLALAALVVWLLVSSGSSHPRASGKPAATHHQAPAATVPADSSKPQGAPTLGDGDHRALIPASRGGLASLIVTKKTTRLQPATSVQAVARAAKPTSSEEMPPTPSTNSTNCGFGSLTYAGC